MVSVLCPSSSLAVAKSTLHLPFEGHSFEVSGSTLANSGYCPPPQNSYYCAANGIQEEGTPSKMFLLLCAQIVPVALRFDLIPPDLTFSSKSSNSAGLLDFTRG